MGRRRETPRRRVLDAGALVAIERGDRRIRALAGDDTRYVIPATVLAQVWRGSAHQARLAAFLAASDRLIEPLEELGAKAIGVILARTRTKDVIDASVVLTARQHNAVVLTGDATDLLRIDPALPVVEI